MNRKKTKVNINTVFWTICFLMLALPLHTSNAILSYLSITGSVSIFHLIMLLLALLVVLSFNGKSKLNLSFAVNMIFALGIGIATIIGMMSNNPINSVLGDGGMYLLSFCLLICLCSKKVKGKTLPQFLNFLYRATFFSCAMSMLMYLTRSLSIWGMTSYNSGRYFGGYLSLLIVTIPYVLYRYLYLKNMKLSHMLVYYVLAFSCLALAQSRTAFFAIGIGAVLAVIAGSKKMKSQVFMRILLISVVGFGVVAVFLNSSMDVVNRLLATNLQDRNETSFARIYLYLYYIPLILRAPIGKGFGETMYFVSRSMMLQGDTGTYTVDCAYITAGYKGGWCLLLVYIVATLIPLFRAIKNYRITKDRLYMLFAAVWFFYVFATAIITGQIIHTIPALTLFWLLSGLSMKREMTEYGKNNKKPHHLAEKQYRAQLH